MAILVFYGDNAGGYIESTNASYATARSGGTLTANDSATTAQAGQYYYSSYYCWEAFVGFDTSAIPDSSTISSATLSLYGSGDFSYADFTVEARVYDWGSSLTTGDYVAGASLSALTSVATFATSSTWAGAYNAFTNVALPANVSKTGTTRLIIYSSRHSGNNTPGGYEVVYFYTTDETGTTKDPTLAVTISSPTISIKKISTVSREQIKKLSGQTNA